MKKTKIKAKNKKENQLLMVKMKKLKMEKIYNKKIINHKK